MKTSIGAKEIVFPTPVFIVGTYGEDGKPNAMNVAWGGICSSNPPCVAISIRKKRLTYKNILKNQAFTVNIPSMEFVKEADYFGLVSGKQTNKFEDTGLTPVHGDLVEAPYILEFPMNLECKLLQMVEIGEHVQCIGEIVDLKVDESCLDEKGLPDVGKMDPILFDPGAYVYYKTGGKAEKAFFAGKSFMKK